MAYQRGDNRYGGNDERWRDRDRGGRYDERGSYGRDRYSSDRYDRGYGDNDRGFFERASDEVRSWFGDEDAERRRERDERRYEREQRMQDRDYGRSTSWRGEHEGGGWGNQSPGDTPRSINRERSDSDYYSRYEPGNYGEAHEARYGRAANTWGGSGYGGDYERGRRFDRIDSGSTGTQGAHPMSSPVGGTGIGGYSAYQSSARRAAMYDNDRMEGYRDHHDRHYSEWRNRQIDELDRDYDEYRREHQSKFEQDFGNWRSKRNEQRRSMNRVKEHMDVVGSDGEHVGTVDKVRGDHIILTKSDPDAGGHHHSIPCSWIESVDDSDNKVRINKTADEAHKAWRDIENNRAMFDRDRDNEGPHALNRSFSGTYDNNG